MAICTYFLKGQCRFGDKCRNGHPAGGTFGSNQSWNRGSTNSSDPDNALLLFTVDSMKDDLTQEKPLWPLSSYGTAKYETNLISGLDESFEELRCRAVSTMAAGNVNQYVQYETDRINRAEKSISDARNNIQQAYDQAVRQSSVASMLNNSIGGPASSSNAFGTSTPAFGSSNSTGLGSVTPSAFGSSTTGSAFGRPSAFGQSSAPSSAFGQTSQPTSVFGQATSAPSVFQQVAPQSNSGISQPSQLSSVFGQSSQPTSSLIKPATTGAFGAYANNAPTAFGAGATPTSKPSSGGFATFANPSGQTATFGAAAPSAFGAVTSSTPSTFGSGGPFNSATSTSAPAPSAFGSQPSNSAFGPSTTTSVFGSSTTPASTSAFGSGSAPSAFGSTTSPVNTSASSVFGAPAPVSAFGATGQATPSAFGSMNTFGSNVSTPFGGGFEGPATSMKSSSSVPDFKSAMSQSYVQEKCPYDYQLPENYLSEVVPKSAIELFKSEKFEWGKVPDWIPPLELR